MTRLICAWIAIALCASCSPAPAGGGTATPSPQPSALHAEIAQWFGARMPTDAQGNAAPGSGQYMRHGCRSANDLPAEWQGLPVQRCDYSHAEYGISVKTTAYLLFPDPNKLAVWIVNACTDGRSSDIRLCAGQLSSAIWNASGAQFAVAGYVVEPASVLPKPDNPDQPYCFQFRNGVTVTTQDWPDTRMHVGNKCGPEAAIWQPPVKAFNRGARVASTTRGQYTAALKAATPAERDRRAGYGVGTDDARSAVWADTTGKEFREAWSSDRNFLLYAKVVSNALAGKPSAF